MIEMGTSMSSVIEDDSKDTIFSQQSSSSQTSSSSASEKQGDSDENGKWNESTLMTLFRTCHTCGVPITDKTVTTTGSQLKIEWTCLNNHYTLFSGTTFTKERPPKEEETSVEIPLPH